MNRTRLYLALAIAFSIVLPLKLHAQNFADSIKWRIWITGVDSADLSVKPTVVIGLHPDAHNPIPPKDTMHDFTDRWWESFVGKIGSDSEWTSAPPAPPGSYWALTNLRQPYVLQYKMMYHQLIDSTMIDTTVVKWASASLVTPDSVNQVWTWPPPEVLRYYADSIVLTDQTGSRLRINMTKVPQYVYNPFIDTVVGIPKFPISTSNMRLIIFHPKRAILPPDSVISVHPTNGQSCLSQGDSVTWQPIATPLFPGMVIYYRVQIASSPTFTPSSIVFQDSIPGTSRNFGSLAPNRWYYWRVKAFAPYGVGIYKTVVDSFFVGLPVPAIALVSPAAGATNQPDSVNLVWHKYPYGSMSYRVQLSSSPSFSSLLGDTLVSDTSFKFPVAFAACDTFYWRVQCKNQCGTGSFVSTSFRAHFDVPVTPTPLRLADNATNVSLTGVRFSWFGKDACTDQYRFQLAKDSNFASLFVTSTTTDTFTIVSNFNGLTTYYWHVRSENSSKSSPYSMRRMFTTVLTHPDPPTLMSPANGARIASTSTVLQWHKATNNPARYRVEVSADPQVHSPWIVVDSTLTDTTKSIGPLPGCSTFYWHVLASNDSGSSAFSTTWSFITPQIPPDTVHLISPADGATGQSQNTTMQWAPTGSCLPAKYILDIALDAGFSNMILAETLSATTRTYGPLGAKVTYYWRVCGLDSAGAGAFSARSFTTTGLVAPDVPVLISPPNGQTGTSTTPTLLWDSTARAITWHLQVAYDTGYKFLVVNDSTLTKRSRQIGPLLDSTWFYWRVSAKNDSGASKYSGTFSFYTMSPPGMPSLVRPLNGQIDVPVVPTFYWTLPSGTDLFQLQVSRDSNFTNFIFNDSTLTTTTYTLNIWLSGYTKYFWRLRAKNPAGWGPFTAFWTFRTARVGAANWFLPLAIAETGPQHDTIYFGVHPLATFGIDPSLGELEMPQPPPPGIFDFRFIDIPSRPGLLGQGLRLNMLPFIAYAQVDTYRVHFQPGVGTYPMKFSWPARSIQPICDSMILQDEFGGLTVHAHMERDSVASVSNSGLSTLLIIEYGVFPLGVKKEKSQAPKGFVLSQNYPNPFNPTTQIRFSTEHAAYVDLRVYDMLGREIGTLAASNFSPGEYSVTWDGRDKDGVTVPSGVYYVRMVATDLSGKDSPAGKFTATRKMLMMK